MASSSMVGLPVSAKAKPPRAASVTASSTVYNSSMVSFCFGETLTYGRLSSSSSAGLRKKNSSPAAVSIVAAANTKPDPLRIMISGAPASGKGTQCELIVKKVKVKGISKVLALKTNGDWVGEGDERMKGYTEFERRGSGVICSIM